MSSPRGEKSAMKSHQALSPPRWFLAQVCATLGQLKMMTAPARRLGAAPNGVVAQLGRRFRRARAGRCGGHVDDGACRGRLGQD